MAKQRKITHAGEFTLGIIVNFIGIASVIVATILFLFRAVDVTMDAASLQSNFPMSVASLSLFFFLGGLSAICIGSYMKKQQGLLRWQFLIAIVGIIFGLAIFFIFVVIVKNLNLPGWVSNSMCFYFQYLAHFIIYVGCFLLVRGNIKAANTFHAQKCLKINNCAGILMCLMLIFYYITQITSDASNTSSEWVLWMQLAASICEALAAIITIYILLITTRGFSSDWTKLVKIVALCTAIICALAGQMSVISTIIALHYTWNPTIVNGLVKAGFWCETAYLACFIPFTLFIMNWKNLLPARVAY